MEATSPYLPSAFDIFLCLLLGLHFHIFSVLPFHKSGYGSAVRTEQKFEQSPSCHQFKDILRVKFLSLIRHR